MLTPIDPAIYERIQNLEKLNTQSSKLNDFEKSKKKIVDTNKIDS